MLAFQDEGTGSYQTLGNIRPSTQDHFEDDTFSIY